MSSKLQWSRRTVNSVIMSIELYVNNDNLKIF